MPRAPKLSLITLLFALIGCGESEVELKTSADTRPADTGAGDPFAGQDCIDASLATGEWTEAFEAMVACDCSDSPACHGLYNAQLVAEDGRTATLRFKKADGSPASTTFYWWLVDFGTLEPTCDTIGLPQHIAEGTWQAGDATIDVTVELWTQAEVLAGIASPRRLVLITGGAGHEVERIWFQLSPVDFAWTCASR